MANQPTQHYWNEREIRAAFKEARQAIHEETMPRSENRKFGLWIIDVTEAIFRDKNLLPPRKVKQ